MKRIKDIPGLIIASELFIAIALSLLLFNHEQGRESLAENRILASFPEIKTESGEISPSLSADLAAWFEDNLGLRDAYLTLSGILNYNLLHRSKTSKVETGKDGFLYLSDEGNLSMGVSRSQDFIEKLPEYAARQQMISDSLKEQSVDYVFFICPGKPSVYPEYIASSDHQAEDTIGDAIYDRLISDTDVNVYWPKADLVAAKNNPDGELIYLKTDTHWTTYGRNIAYRGLIERLNEWGISDTSPARVRFYVSDDPYVGDLSNMMGPVTWSGKRLAEDSFTDWETVAPKAEVVQQGEKYDAFRKLLDEKKTYNPELCVMYHNEAAEKKNVLIFGDSMVGICLLPQLAECFSDMTFVWSYNIDQDYIDLVKPDIVISEFGERELPLRLDIKEELSE